MKGGDSEGRGWDRRGRGWDRRGREEEKEWVGDRGRDGLIDI